MSNVGGNFRNDTRDILNSRITALDRKIEQARKENAMMRVIHSSATSSALVPYAKRASALPMAGQIIGAGTLKPSGYFQQNYLDQVPRSATQIRIPTRSAETLDMLDRPVSRNTIKTLKTHENQLNRSSKSLKKGNNTSRSKIPTKRSQSISKSTHSRSRSRPRSKSKPTNKKLKIVSRSKSKGSVKPLKRIKKKSTTKGTKSKSQSKSVKPLSRKKAVDKFAAVKKLGKKLKLNRVPKQR